MSSCNPTSNPSHICRECDGSQPNTVEELEDALVGYGLELRDTQLRLKIAMDALSGIICNGPMSYEEHSKRADRLATEALSQIRGGKP